MHLFYAYQLSPEDREYMLSPSETAHALKVLRMQPGSLLQLTDGRGNLYKARIINQEKVTALLRILEVIPQPKNDVHIHIAISPTKNSERIEWLIEKLTEVGVSEITPVICRRTERKDLNIERFKRKAVSGIKQSCRVWLPKINQSERINRFIEQSDSSNKLIAHCAEGYRQTFADAYKKNQNALVLVGPEGDFSQDEINDSINKGFKPVSLGSGILRTETAGLIACSYINFINNL